jgi:hypothetical protein
MVDGRKHFSLPRMLALLAVLILETGLTVSLWADGWLGTGSNLRLLACAAAAALPLSVAAWLLLRNRFRFGLRSLLAAMALVAAFMYFTVRPLLEASEARRASRLLIANGAEVFTESNRGDFYVQLGYDPHPPRAYESLRGAIPAWLRPLAGDLPNFPPNDEVIDVWLQNNAQVAAFCEVANEFANLEDVGVGDVSPKAMELLRTRLPTLPRLVEVAVNGRTDVPADWLSSLTNVRSLSIWAEGNRMGSPLAIEHLQDIAKLPQLEVLLLFGYTVDDADIQVLAESKSLRFIVLKYSKVSEAAKRRLSDAMPHCEIRGD